MKNVGAWHNINAPPITDPLSYRSRCKAHRTSNPEAWNEYRCYVAAVPGPKIVCVQDLDNPRVIGSFWGEVNSNMQQALGCLGTLVDGAIRDLYEMTHAGFKALARRLCAGTPMFTRSAGIARLRSLDARCALET